MRPPGVHTICSILIFGFIQQTNSKSLIDCFHGFVGEIQSSLRSGYFPMNETRMCAAEWCMKVKVHSARDSDGFARRGVASRCAYTGGDRTLCFSAAERGGTACTTVTHYDGMAGNFSLCCCRSSFCNHPLPEELVYNDEIPVSKQRRESVENVCFSFPSLFIISFVLSLLLLNN